MHVSVNRQRTENCARPRGPAGALGTALRFLGAEDQISVPELEQLGLPAAVIFCTSTQERKTVVVDLGPSKMRGDLPPSRSADHQEDKTFLNIPAQLPKEGTVNTCDKTPFQPATFLDHLQKNGCLHASLLPSQVLTGGKQSTSKSFKGLFSTDDFPSCQLGIRFQDELLAAGHMFTTNLLHWFLFSSL